MSAHEVDTESIVAAGMDGWAIAVVRGLRHREGTRHTCKCEECKSIVRVCALATERLAMSQRKGRRRERTTQAALVALLDHYVTLVKSGDAGFWDAEKEPVVAAARAALGAYP